MVDTDMNDYAQSHTFIALYPEQLATSNSSMCWNWFLPAHRFRVLANRGDIQHRRGGASQSAKVIPSQSLHWNVGGAMACRWLIGCIFGDLGDSRPGTWGH
jgi:hypothetical protein